MGGVWACVGLWGAGRRRAARILRPSPDPLEHAVQARTGRALARRLPAPPPRWLTHRAHGEEDCKCLPDVVVEPPLPDRVDKHLINLAQHVQRVALCSRRKKHERACLRVGA